MLSSGAMCELLRQADHPAALCAAIDRQPATGENLLQAVVRQMIREMIHGQTGVDEADLVWAATRTV